MRDGFPHWLSGKESACNAEDTGSISCVGRIPWRRAWQPTPAFLLENPMDRGAGRATVHSITRSRTRLSERAHTQCALY